MRVFATVAAIVAITAIPAMAVCAPQLQDVAQTGGLGLPSAAAAVEQITGAGSAAGVASTVANAAPVAGQSSDLVDTLVRQLGITPEQASGGAGSIFSMVKQGMNPADFAKVSAAVPGMNELLAAAPSQAAPSSNMTGLMGMAASALGGSGSSVTRLTSLAGSFQSLGLNSGMVSRFIPVILQSVQSQGGSAAMDLLQSALAH
ncbi:MAG: DUF2780 domain-containing protein [Methylococcales bacterium]|nr:DUF2780 domain-containing protein [Methylococcales bacterium]MDD5631398.1 DUF2780 domain-containing protein [Methylococcales bacterium]